MNTREREIHESAEYTRERNYFRLMGSECTGILDSIHGPILIKTETYITNSTCHLDTYLEYDRNRAEMSTLMTQ